MINLFTGERCCDKAVSGDFGAVSTKMNTARQVLQGREGLGLEIGQRCEAASSSAGKEKWWLIKYIHRRKQPGVLKRCLSERSRVSG